MWQSLVVLMLVAVSIGHAANSTDEVTKFAHELDCPSNRKMLFFERKACVTKYIKHQTQDNTTVPTIDPDGNCTNIDAMLNDFSRRLKNYSQCFNNDSATYIERIKDRLQLLQKATEPSLYQDFITGGLKCVKDNVKNIQVKCLDEVLKNETQFKDIKYSLNRIVPPLTYGTRSCAKSLLITNCVINIFNSTCPDSNAEHYVRSLSKILINDHCGKNTSVITDQETQKNVSPTSGIIIGILVGIIALLVLGLFATRNLKICSKPQTESYTINFRQQTQQKESS